MADDYRSSPQWQALNRIWKAVPPSARDGVKEDFRLITEVIKSAGANPAAENPSVNIKGADNARMNPINADSAPAANASPANTSPANADRNLRPSETAPANPAPAAFVPGARENFLKGMSAPARRLALSLLTREGFDIYAFLENLMHTSGAHDADELWDAYVSERDIEEENEDALREIVETCVSRLSGM